MSNMMIEVGPDHSSNDVCDTCGLRRWWHTQNRPEHPFRTADERSERFQQPPEPPPTPKQLGDPILRAALIHAGVITEGQLTEAEAWVREAARRGMALVVTRQSYELQSAEAVAREVGKDAAAG